MTDREIAAQVIDDLNRALDAAIERADKWRTCADQLAADLCHLANLSPSNFAEFERSEALAVYERLKGANS